MWLVHKKPTVPPPIRRTNPVTSHKLSTTAGDPPPPTAQSVVVPLGIRTRGSGQYPTRHPTTHFGFPPWFPALPRPPLKGVFVVRNTERQIFTRQSFSSTACTCCQGLTTTTCSGACLRSYKMRGVPCRTSCVLFRPAMDYSATPADRSLIGDEARRIALHRRPCKHASSEARAFASPP